MNEEQAKFELENGYKQAEVLISEPEKLEKFLTELEEKLKVIPKVGNTLAIIPEMISMIRSYVKKEYTEIPLGTILASLSALIYLVSPIDVIADAIPAVGYIDDAIVVATCLKLINSDVEKYREWKKNSHI